jgi:hypothetical protein
VALPNAGGPLPLFVSTRDGLQTTPEWDMLCDQLAGVPDLKLVGLDPLSTFAQAELDADNNAAAFITGADSDEAGRGFRFEAGHDSDLKPATVPI